MRWAFAALLCATFCVVPVRLFAQAYDEGQFYGGYSYLNFDTNGVTSRQGANGWDAGASANVNKWVGAEFSVSGYYKTYTIPNVGNVTFHDYSYGAGPKFDFGRFFVHALLGGNLATSKVLGASHTQNGFAGAFGGGVQKRISGPWTLRMSTDYVFSRLKLSFEGPAYLQNNYRVTVAIAYIFRGHDEEESQSRSSSASVSMPVLGVTVLPTQGNKGAEIVEITPGGVADVGGLRPGYVITSVNTMEVHTPMELAAALSGLSGNVNIGYAVKTSASGWMANVTTVVFGKQE